MRVRTGITIAIAHACVFCVYTLAITTRRTRVQRHIYFLEPRDMIDL